MTAESSERLLNGVRRGDMFIRTYSEFKAGFLDRHATIEASFPEEPLDVARAEAMPLMVASPAYLPDNRLASLTPPATLPTYECIERGCGTTPAWHSDV
jgi:hypothetical protein